jgi:quinoprotein glucose dehydrogenase
MPRLLRLLALAPFVASAAVFAVPPDADLKAKKPASEADTAARAAQVEGGLAATVWAAEPLLANPVAFAFDERGRCFVAETDRMHDGVPDTRGFMHWLDDDIGSRSVADRLKKYQTHKYPDFTKFTERLRLVWDSKGTGTADSSAVFADGFNAPSDGLAAGVLARKGTVYFTCIPDLYAFGADPKSPAPTSKASLATGFGIRDQFVGHDLHGLRMGPDGKMYFSVGDRGLNVTTRDGRHLFNPDSGAVLRCDPDGSNMEIVHVGLRNPQELAFDDHGNLFTYDNNSDSGDQARWVQVVEGGDSGWRCGYQYGTLMHTPNVPQGNRGPWNTEKIWHVPGPDGGPPAYVVPPLKNFGNGPAGLTHYPGVGLNDRYKDHFFACDFTAGPGNSKIWTLAVKPKGASFEVTDLHPFVQNMVPTDCEFGPDGAFYWLDWLGGWAKPGKGRIFRVADPAAMKNPAVAEAQKLFAEGFGKKTPDELAKLLGHPHQGVRLEAQYELASRLNVPQADPRLTATILKAVEAASNGGKPQALHAVWLAGTVRPNADAAGDAGQRDQSRRDWTNLIESVLKSAADADVRGQAAKVYGGMYGATADKLLPCLADPDARVRYHAATSYAKLAKSDAAGYRPLLQLLKSNDDADPYIRHSAVIGLARMSDKPDTLLAEAKAFDTPAVRLGVVLALRKLHSPKVGEFLNDPDPTVAVEAVRAVNDLELMGPMAELAKLADKPGLADPVAYRALNANFKLGQPEHAARVARFAARSGEPDHLRVAALKLLADWSKPPRRDAVTGLTQSLPERPASVARDAVRPVARELFAGSDAVRKEAVQAVSKIGLAEVGPMMAGIVADAKQPAGTRADALFALQDLRATELDEAIRAALASDQPRLRAAGRVAAAKADPVAAAAELPALLNDPKAAVVEKQMALGVLGGMRGTRETDAALAAWLDKLIAGQVPDELKLDVLEAAQKRADAKGPRLTAPLREKLREYDQNVRAVAGSNTALRYPEAKAGGDPDKGREIFFNSAAVYCQRCHKVGGQGGEVGPALDGIGAQKPREYLVESIVVPNAQIAQGFQSVILSTADGRTVSGVLRSKDKKQYVLVTPDNKVVTVPADDVESERPDKSVMPDDLYKKLSKRELRDLVEYLASLKEPAKK